MWWVVSAGLALYASFFRMVRPGPSPWPETLRAALLSYDGHIGGFAWAVWVMAFMVIWVKLMTYDAYAAILVRNATKRLLTLSIRQRQIGDVAPGREIRNKKVLANYQTYLVEPSPCLTFPRFGQLWAKAV